MKTIGLIGGTSWESTAVYYQLINQETQKQLGGLNSAKIILNSLNLAHVKELQLKGDFEAVINIFITAAQTLENAGANFLVICANTPHLFAPMIQDKINIDLIHITQATGEQIKHDGLNKIGLLGTKVTMESGFYADMLQSDFNIETLIPNQKERNNIDHAIFNELCLGQFNDETKNMFLNIITDLEQKGAQGVILGCTEIPLIITQDMLKLPLYDTTAIHAKKAVQLALS